MKRKERIVGCFVMSTLLLSFFYNGCNSNSIDNNRLKSSTERDFIPLMEYRPLSGSQLDSTCLEILATKVPKDRSVGWLRSTLPGAPDSVYSILPFCIAVDTSLNFIDWTMLNMYQFNNPPSYIKKVEELYDIDYYSLSLSIRAQLLLLSRRYQGLDSLLKRYNEFIHTIDEQAHLNEIDRFLFLNHFLTCLLSTTPSPRD